MNQECEQNTEQGIDLSRLFWCICRKWRMVLCWMIAAAFAVGAVKFALSAYNLSQSKEISVAKATYEVLVANNRAERNEILKRYSDITTEINEKLDYEENSRYMKIDPYNVHVAKRVYYVKTDYQIMPGMDYQNPDYTSTIVNSYVQLLTSEGNLQSVAEKCDMERRYLSELVGAWSNGAGNFTVRVICDDANDAKTILDLMDRIVTSNKELIQSALDEHTVGQLTESFYTTVDEGLLEQQQKRRDAVSALRTQFTELTERYDELKDEIQKIKAPTVSMASAAKSSIKMAIIGAFIGLLIACMIICVQTTLGNRIASADDLARRQGIRILGALPANPAKLASMKKPDCFFRRKVGLSVSTNEAGIYAAATSYLASAYPEAGTVLVAGNAEESYIQAACEAMQTALPEVKFLKGSNLASDAETIRRIGQCDLVVLVEHTGVSTYGDVSQETETVKRLKGTVAGVLMIED